MSIGAELAQARRRAGLSVADVSARTRIRQALIRAIERDDFAACGGDFYARGHIRAIARAVGTDSVPLIAEYDTRDAGGPASLDELLGGTAPAGPGPGAGAGAEPILANRALPDPIHVEPRFARNRAGTASAVPAPPEPRPRRGAGYPWRLLPIVFAALAVIGIGTYRVSGAPDGGPARPASASRATTPPASHSPTHSASASRSPSASPPAPPRLVSVTPVNVAAFGPSGTSDGDNPDSASGALSGKAGSAWQTHWYTSARFGNLKPGTGLLFDLGRTVTATAVTVRLGHTSGAAFQVRAGRRVGGLHAVASVTGTGSTVRVNLRSPVAARYLVIWFTSLPPNGNGTYQAAVSGLKVSAVSR